MDRSDFRLNWMLPAAPLGLPLRLRGAWEISDAKAKSAARRIRDFETRDFTDDLTPAVAPAVAPSARPGGEPDWLRPGVECFYVSGSTKTRVRIIEPSADGERWWNENLEPHGCLPMGDRSCDPANRFMPAQPAKREPHSAPMERQPVLKVWTADLMWESL